MSKSIVDNNKSCFVCGDERDLDRHHIFYGMANRRLSEEDGCWIYLCKKHHTMSNVAVHENHPFDVTLKKLTQKIWEETYGTRTEFIKRYGRNYL